MIQENLEKIEARLASALQRSGRKREDIELMVVSKTQPVERIQEVYDLGIRLFGENRVAEAEEKFTGRFDEARLHLIGHIQRNKAAKAVRIASWVQSIDSLRTIGALDKHADDAERNINILLEVNTSNEESKHGIRDRDQVFPLIEEVLASRRLRLSGLMTMAPFTDDQHRIRESFQGLHRLREECARQYGDKNFSVLSMGMTSDFEIAVEEGSTLIRIGTAVFKERG